LIVSAVLLLIGTGWMVGRSSNPSSTTSGLTEQIDAVNRGEFDRDTRERRGGKPDPISQRIVDNLPDNVGNEHREEYEFPGDAPTGKPINFWLELGPIVTELPFDSKVRIEWPGQLRGQHMRFRQDTTDKSNPVWRSSKFRGQLSKRGEKITLVLSHPKRGGICKLSCKWEPDTPMSLFVFTVGVSRYPHVNKLSYAHTDAEAIRKAFLQPQSRLFDQVIAPDSLTEENATRDRIVPELERFAQQVRDCKKGLKLAIVYFAGQGSVLNRQSHIFWPWDYSYRQSARRITWPDLQLALAVMDCPVLLILDTCHCGKASEQFVGARGNSIGDIEQAVQQLSRQRARLMILTAASADERASEYKALGHGVLTFALLEALNRQQDRRYPATQSSLPRSVSPKALGDHAEKRVPELQEYLKGENPPREQKTAFHSDPHLDVTKLELVRPPGPSPE
jgi:hypothetical protein